MIKSELVIRNAFNLTKKYIGFFIAIYTLIFLTTQTAFAGIHISIKGKVNSYSDGTYTIQTDQSLFQIKDDKLTLELKRTLQRRIGRQVQITIPHRAVFSQKALKSSESNRKPANTENTSTQDLNNEEEEKGCSK